MATSSIPHKFIACILDMSQYVSEELLARCGGKVYLSGFYNEALHTHLCEMTPSYFVDGLGYVPENYPEDEKLSNALNEELLENMVEGSYYHCSRIKALREKNPDHFKELDFTFDVDDDPDEMVREHLQGNPCF
jgi:hypothetical protein